MSFPTSPINGQETTINGITYTFSSSNNAWTRKPRQLFTAGVNAPANPAPGDQWYDTSDDILYQYINDGTGNYWVDIRSGIFGGNSASLGETQIAGNLIPTTNITYTLGNTTHRFKDLWLAGNTIYLGGATISTSGSNVAITNPAGGSFSVTGSVAGSANVSFGNVFANYFFANGAAFTSSNYGNTEVAAYLVANPQGSTYSNSNVIAYMNSVGGIGANTTAIVLPTGTTAQRPTAANGMMRYNTTTTSIECYIGGNWVTLVQANYTISYLIVAGGGGGGWDVGGGGGAGGLLYGTFNATPGNNLTVVVGAGGGGSASGSVVGSNGGNSSVTGTGIGSQLAWGGGGGGSWNGVNGAAGGSGGGGTSNTTGVALGVVGQGYNGGAGSGNGGSTNNYSGSAGGGGAGGVGGNGATSGWSANSASIGNGGIGRSDDTLGNILTNSLTGVVYSGLRYIAGGGGGSDNISSQYGRGGAGGGANGGNKGAGGANNGVAATGGGGGGGGQSPENGGNGGSGLVVLQYTATTQRGTGGNVYSISAGGGLTTYSHIFASTGSFTYTI